MDLVTLLFSFFFGMLTVLSPCTLPLLPIIVGGSVQNGNKWRPWLIVAGLAGSFVLFTLLLQTFSQSLNISAETWKIISGCVIIFFGLITLFPDVWKRMSSVFGGTNSSQQLLQKAGKKTGLIGAVLTGAALGPVFTSCSPTYALIVAIILPSSFAAGLIYLIAYAVGLTAVLGVIAVFGQKAAKKMRFAADPKGAFKKVLGVIFLLVGVAIIQNWDKKFEAWVIEQGLYIDTYELEQGAVDRIKETL